jgi:hypothetical protein
VVDPALVRKRTAHVFENVVQRVRMSRRQKARSHMAAAYQILHIRKREVIPEALFGPRKSFATGPGRSSLAQAVDRGPRRRQDHPPVALYSPCTRITGRPVNATQRSAIANRTCSVRWSRAVETVRSIVVHPTSPCFQHLRGINHARGCILYAMNIPGPGGSFLCASICGNALRSRASARRSP